MPRVSALLLLLVVAPAFSLARADEYYYANGKKIALQGSDQYVGYKLKPQAALSKTTTRRLVAKVHRAPTDQAVVVAKAASRAVPSLEADLRGTQATVEDEVPVFLIDKIPSVVTDQVIVRFMDGVSAAEIEGALAGMKHKPSPDAEGKYIVKVSGDYKETLRVANALALKTELVRYAQPNFTYIVPQDKCYAGEDVKSAPPKPAGAAGPAAAAPPSVASDAFFDRQWALRNSGVSGKAGADIRVAGAWLLPDGKGRKETTIAIVDEGVDDTHPDLAAKITRPYDTLKNQAVGRPNPWEPHGTACAGIAAAVPNTEGIVGVGWSVGIMPIRVARRSMPQTEWITSDDAIASGIRKATDQGADVISASLTSGSSSDVTDAINTAVTKGRGGKGAVVVVAAGNEGVHAVGFPATLAAPAPEVLAQFPNVASGVLAVGATNEWDEAKANDSSDGEDWWGSNFGPEITVAAPGVHIMTTDINGKGGYVEGDYVGNFNGTSAATPHVAGLAALIISQHPDWTAAKVKNQIVSTVDDVGPPGFDEHFGYGRINACRALGASNCEAP